LLRPIGNVIVLMPPLNASVLELRRMVAILSTSLSHI